MATGKTSGNAEFMKFLSGAPTLDEASAQDTTELTGVVSRTTDGKFAITASDGQTYELDVSAVQQFRVEEGPGFSKVATIQVTNDGLKAAVVRPMKPVFKDLPKDPIKEIINDGKFPPFDTPPGKDFYKDPVTDKPHPIDTLAAKDIGTDPVVDHKRFVTDPNVDTSHLKDVHKDPLSDPVGTARFKDVHKDPLSDPVGTSYFKDVHKDPLTDPIKDLSQEGIPPDPIDPTVNPAAGGLMPFAIATQHHAPQELLAMQMGGAQMAGVPGAQHYKPLPWEKHPWAEKVPWRDTRKEMIWDPTFKEIVHDPQTFWEPTFDPTQLGRGPLPEPWAGAQGFGM
jgi:hypothetical protein